MNPLVIASLTAGLAWLIMYRGKSQGNTMATTTNPSSSGAGGSTPVLVFDPHLPPGRAAQVQASQNPQVIFAPRSGGKDKRTVPAKYSAAASPLQAPLKKNYSILSKPPLKAANKAKKCGSGCGCSGGGCSGKCMGPSGSAGFVDGPSCMSSSTSAQIEGAFQCNPAWYANWLANFQSSQQPHAYTGESSNTPGSYFQQLSQSIAPQDPFVIPGMFGSTILQQDLNDVMNWNWATGQPIDPNQNWVAPPPGYIGLGIGEGGEYGGMPGIPVNSPGINGINSGVPVVQTPVIQGL